MNLALPCRTTRPGGSSLLWWSTVFALLAGLPVCVRSETVPSSSEHKRLRATPAELPAVLCSLPPKLKADPEDPAWLKSPVASDFKDAFSAKSSIDQTEARIVYDSKAIYVLFVCHDSHPKQIVGREITPEAQFNGEDTVTFSIDTFHTRSGASLSHFTVNAINTRTETIAGGHSSKAEWRGIWTSDVRRTMDGYNVEMRIPWKILNYPTGGKPVDMDLNFERYQARTKDGSQWAYTTPSFKPELLGAWKGVVPPSSDERSRWDFLAYDAPSAKSGVSSNGVFSNRAGLDARYQVSVQQTALLSINPDFVNIEQQIAGVSFVHTERFLQDARPFFTEGGDFFNPVGQYEYGIPFYSQRIGPINAGTKFYGQVSPDAKVGALAVNQTDGSTAAVANYQLNPSSTFTDSIYATSYDGSTTDQLIGNTINKRWGNWYASFDGALESAQHGSDTAGNYAVGYTGPKLLSLVQGEWVNTSFDPILAYIPWQDRRGFYSYTNYNDTIKKGPIHDFSGSLYLPDFYESGGIPQERGYSASGQFTTRADQSLSVARNVVDYQNGSDDYIDTNLTFNASNRFKQFGIEYLFGRQSSLPSHYLDLKSQVRVFHRIDLGLERSVLTYSPDASQTIGALGWQIDAKRAVVARYVDTNGLRNFFLSYSNSGFTGVETYVILGDPNSPTFSRKVSVKLVWAF